MGKLIPMAKHVEEIEKPIKTKKVPLVDKEGYTDLPIDPDGLNPDDAEWYDRETLQQLTAQTEGKPRAPPKKGKSINYAEEIHKGDIEIMDLRLELALLKDKMKEKQNYNAFLKWLLAANPADYPMYDGIIKRIQTFKRTSFVKDIIGLLQVWEGLP